MNQSLATFMKMAITVTAIVALLFMVGYTLADDEVKNFGDNVINSSNHGGSATDPHGLKTTSSPTRAGNS